MTDQPAYDELRKMVRMATADMWTAPSVVDERTKKLYDAIRAEAGVRDAARQAAGQQPAAAPVAPCETTRHCATHGFCHRCAPESTKAVQYLVKAIRAAEVDDSRAGAVYARLAAVLFATEHTCPDGEPCPAHDEPATDPLSDADRKLLTFALDCAVHEMAYVPESQSDEDRAALTRLRRLADGTAR